MIVVSVAMSVAMSAAPSVEVVAATATAEAVVVAVAVKAAVKLVSKAVVKTGAKAAVANAAHALKVQSALKAARWNAKTGDRAAKATTAADRAPTAHRAPSRSVPMAWCSPSWTRSPFRVLMAARRPKATVATDAAAAAAVGATAAKAVVVKKASRTWRWHPARAQSAPTPQKALRPLLPAAPHLRPPPPKAVKPAANANGAAAVAVVAATATVTARVNHANLARPVTIRPPG